MLVGRAPMASTPMLRAFFVDGAIPAKIVALLATPEAKRNYALELEPWDPELGDVVLRTFGAGESRIPGAEDRLWSPRLEVAFNVQTQLFDGPLGFGGVGRPSFGVIQLAFGDEVEKLSIFRDDYAWHYWNRRAIRLYLGGDPKAGWTWADFSLIFGGLSEDIQWDEDRVSLIVRDPTVRLDVPIGTNLYAGTGSYEGGTDLKGKTKPICYGRPQNISPILIDRLNLVYQWHDGQVLQCGTALDKGDAYTYDGDLTNIYAWTQVEGHFVSDNSRGLIRLGSTANGIVTLIDAAGSWDGTVFGFRDRQGNVIQSILVDRCGFTDGVAGDIDLASLAQLDLLEREIGIYLREPGSTTVASVIDAILLPDGYRTFDNAGRFVAGMVRFSPPILTVQPPAIVSIARDRTPPPAWRLSMGYARNWTPMQEDDLAVILTVEGSEVVTTPATLAIDRDFALNEFRRVTKEDDAIKLAFPGALDEMVDTYWIYEADAQAELEDAWSILSVARDRYRVVLMNYQFRLRAAQTITLIHPRFGLDLGKNFIILGIAEDTKSGQTTLDLWG